MIKLKDILLEQEDEWSVEAPKEWDDKYLQKGDIVTIDMMKDKGGRVVYFDVYNETSYRIMAIVPKFVGVWNNKREDVIMGIPKKVFKSNYKFIDSPTK
jgi:hypothetical protein